MGWWLLVGAIGCCRAAAPLRHGYAVPPPPGGGGKESGGCMFACHLAPPKGELSAKPTERGRRATSPQGVANGAGDVWGFQRFSIYLVFPELRDGMWSVYSTVYSPSSPK